MSYILYQSGASVAPRRSLVAIKVVFTVQPTGAVNGVALTGQPVVQLQDASNQPVPTAGIAVSIGRSAGSATLSGTQVIFTDVNGNAAFTGLTLTGVGGSHSLIAGASGLTNAVSAAFTLTAGVAAQLGMVTQPSGATDVAVLTTQPAVRLQDQSGNNVSQAGVNVTAAIGTGTGSLSGGGSIATAANGIATFTSVAVDATAPPSDFTLAFSSGVLTGVTSTSFTVVPVPGTTPYYTTAFPLTENPISEAGKWTDGKSVNLDLADVQTTPGKCFGTQTGTNNLDDSTASLAGSWAPDQIIQATVFNGGAAGSKECELHLRFTAGAHSITGYECLIPVGGGQGEIVRWTGISGGQITFVSLVSGNVTVANGDVFSASIIGTTIRIFRAPGGSNPAQVLTTTDASYATGRPGVGFFRRNDGPQNSDFGFTTITATSATRLAIVTQPAGAVDALAFATQPAVRVINSLSENVPHPGIVVTATIQTGTGVPVGATTATTDANGVATFTTLGIDATTPPSSFTLRFSASFAGQSLTTVDSSSLSVTAVGAVTQFYNSTEVGGDGSDADVLWADDFNRGWYYQVNFDQASALYGGALTPTGILHTAGWGGTIFNTTPIPSGGVPGVLINQRGAVYAASHGTKTGQQGADWMADHNLARAVTEFYSRFDCFFGAGYTFGAEKIWDVNPPNWLGGGGIFWGNLHLNLGGGQAATGLLSWQGTTGPSYSTGFTLSSGRWYGIQLYCKRGSGGADGILKVWADDLGVTGTTVPGGGIPTLRLSRTDYPFNPASGSFTQFGSIWAESWSNPGSTGNWYFTNVMCREFNGGTNGNSPILIRAS